jgi:hypothetical protein
VQQKTTTNATKKGNIEDDAEFGSRLDEDAGRVDKIN